MFVLKCNCIVIMIQIWIKISLQKGSFILNLSFINRLPKCKNDFLYSNLFQFCVSIIIIDFKNKINLSTTFFSYTNLFPLYFYICTLIYISIIFFTFMLHTLYLSFTCFHCECFYVNTAIKCKLPPDPLFTSLSHSECECQSSLTL